MRPPEIQNLFKAATANVAAVWPASGFDVAAEVFPERLAFAWQAQTELDRAWVAHRDKGGPLPTVEMAAWESAWTDLGRLVAAR